MKRIFGSMLVLTLLLVSGGSSAFWSQTLYQFHIHQNMTAAALTFNTFEFKGQSNRFSYRALLAIMAANSAVDQESQTPYDARQHFDSEFLASGYVLLENQRAQLLATLADSSSQEESWELLGQILHQIQDFYSHSTWTSTHNTIVDFGALTDGSGTPPDWAQKTSSDIGTVCDDSGVTFTATNGAITTGYYPPRDTPSGKCNHGLHTRIEAGTAVAKCVVQSTVKADGIARDFPCFAEAKNVTAFYIAYNLAQQETAAFIKSLVKQLEANNNGAGYCALLDIPTGVSACGASATLMFTGVVKDIQLYGANSYFNPSKNPVGSAVNGTMTFSIPAGSKSSLPGKIGSAGEWEIYYSTELCPNSGVLNSTKTPVFTDAIQGQGFSYISYPPSAYCSGSSVGDLAGGPDASLIGEESVSQNAAGTSYWYSQFNLQSTGSSSRSCDQSSNPLYLAFLPNGLPNVACIAPAESSGAITAPDSSTIIFYLATLNEMPSSTPEEAKSGFSSLKSEWAPLNPRR